MLGHRPKSNFGKPGTGIGAVECSSEPNQCPYSWWCFIDRPANRAKITDARGLPHNTD